MEPASGLRSITIIKSGWQIRDNHSSGYQVAWKREDNARDLYHRGATTTG